MDWPFYFLNFHFFFNFLSNLKLADSCWNFSLINFLGSVDKISICFLGILEETICDLLYSISHQWHVFCVDLQLISILVQPMSHNFDRMIKKLEILCLKILVGRKTSVWFFFVNVKLSRYDFWIFYMNFYFFVGFRFTLNHVCWLSEMLCGLTSFAKVKNLTGSNWILLAILASF